MHSDPDRKLDLVVDIDDMELALDTAMPCGLIINELVSNSLKYAFNDGRDGRISVQVQTQGDGAYRMRVSDDGIGMKQLPIPGERRSSLNVDELRKMSTIA
jgi:two-component sensor histidine kinase